MPLERWVFRIGSTEILILFLEKNKVSLDEAVFGHRAICPPAGGRPLAKIKMHITEQVGVMIAGGHNPGFGRSRHNL